MPHVPGRFENQIHVFIDDGYLREIVLKVKGTAAGKEEKPNVEQSTSNVHR